METKETAIPAPAARLYERTWVRYNQMTSSVPTLTMQFTNVALGATRKSLIITTLGIFRVGIFATLKMPKQLSLSNLQVALHVSS